MKIGAAELQARMASLTRRLAELDVDAFLVTAKDSIHYLTGVSYEPLERPFFILVRPEEPPALLVPALEKEHLRAAPGAFSVKEYSEYPAPPGRGWPERLLDLCSGVRRLGVEPTLPQEIAARLADLAPRVLPLVEDLRRVKSGAEVQMIRRAARYADLAVEKVIGASYHGVSEIELFSQGRSVQLQIMKDVGYDVLTTSVLAGAWPAPLSAQPHGVPTIADRLGDGPHIALCLCRVFAYAAECERTYFTAPPTRELKRAFAAMTEARRIGYTLIKPGASCSEIDAAVSAFLRREGYGDNLLHRTGHGFGLGNHEGPWVAEGSTDVLEPNMVISNEPGIYLPGVGGLRHSDTVLVTKDGHETLTRHPTDLDTLTITALRPVTRLRGRLVRRAAGLG